MTTGTRMTTTTKQTRKGAYTTMSMKIPWDDIGEPGSSFDIGLAYLFEIEDAELTESKGGKAMVKVMFRCMEPDPGAIYYDNYTLGSDDDPEAKDPATLTKAYGMKLLKKMLSQAGAKLGSDMEKVLDRAKGRKVGIIFKNEKDDRGEERARASRYFAEGEMAPGTNAGKAKAAAPKVATPATKPAAAKRVDDDEDDD